MPLAALVDDLLDRRGLTAQVTRNGVLKEWPSLVGPGIARAARAKDVSGATLFVEVASSPWLMELAGSKSELLKRVNAAVPEFPFQRIVFVLAERGVSSVASTFRRHAPQRKTP